MTLQHTLLLELADEFGIATQLWDWKDRRIDVSDETIAAVLGAMGVDLSSSEAAASALEAKRDRDWMRAIPPCIVMEQGQRWRVFAHVPDGDWIRLAVHLEGGGWRDVPQTEHQAQTRTIDGRVIGESAFDLPGNLPLGYHRLQATTETGVEESMLVVSPNFLGFPQRMFTRRTWGYQAQLYSVRSSNSWGIGDFSDLADLAVWSGTQQFAGFVLVNPLNAGEPKPPLTASPYSPVSRRYINPLYLRLEYIEEYALLSAADLDKVMALKRRLLADLDSTELIDRDLVWTAKIEALRIIYAAKMRPARRMAFDGFVRNEGRALLQFATWCALSLEYGPDWHVWPDELKRPSSPEVSAFGEANKDEIRFFCWLQWVADTQLQQAQYLALDANMTIGIMRDLPVGVGERSAETWIYPDLFADGVTVGAPPDRFNQLGQDWGQAAWRPDRLVELSYAPFRAMVAGLLRHAGGLRIDHVMGMFRLWWVPKGMTPAQGTYVKYRHEMAVGILALEAHRAGALVVGEDLGVVEPWVRTYLRDRGILGTSILWFEKDENGQPLPPENWREYCLASVTTHDLMPTASYLADANLYLQEKLGLLAEPLANELASADVERSSLIDMLRQRGFLEGGDPTTEEIVLAMHRFLLATPSQLLCASLADAVGELRTQNQPGTDKEYPNWRIPLAGPDGVPLLLEDLFDNERARRLASVMNGFS